MAGDSSLGTSLTMIYWLLADPMPVLAIEGAPPAEDPFPTMQVQEAISRVSKYSGHHALSVKKRALLQLGAAGLLNSEYVSRFTNQPSLPAKARARFNESFGLTLTLARTFFDDTDLIRLDIIPPWQVAETINRMLSGSLPAGSCVPLDTSCEVCYDGLTGRYKATARGTVTKPLASRKAPFDPRAWWACHPCTFTKALEVTPNTTGSGNIEGDWDEAHNGTALGESWTGSFYENVAAGITFRNVLDVDYKGLSGGTIYLHYEMNTSYGSGPKLQVDEGHVSAVPIGSYTRVEVVKTIKFQPSSAPLNIPISPVLCNWLESQAEQGGCCEITPTIHPFDKNTAGTKTLLSSSPAARNLVLWVKITEDFVGGGGGSRQPTFEIWAGSTPIAVVGDFRNKPRGATLSFCPPLSANTPLLLIANAAAGAGTGAIDVTVMASEQC